MNKVKKLFWVVGVSCLAFASACATEDSAPLAASPSPPEAPYFSLAGESAAPGDFVADEGELPMVDDRSEKAGCSHIQWCNERGYWGTICIWDACDFETARQECVRDANYVCGGITRPEQLRL